jgi:hypothetical protein
MEEVGWLVVDDFGIHLPEWDLHNSNGAKSRALASLRQAKWRGGNAAVDGKASTAVTVDRLHDRLPEKRREEKKRKEKTKDKEPPAADGVGPFYLADALAMVNLPVLEGIGDLWADWIRMRFMAPRHKRPTRRAAELALKSLGEWTPAQRRTALENTIKNGWQGIFEPKENGNGHRNNGTAHRDNKRANEYPETLTVPVARVPVNGSQGWNTETPL